jgi:hypothetical protein
VVAIVLTYTRSPCPDSAPRLSDCLIEPARLRGGTTWRVALPSERWTHAGAVAALPAALRSLPQLVSIDDPGARYASARTQVAAAFIAANALFLAWVLFARNRAHRAGPAYTRKRLIARWRGWTVPRGKVIRCCLTRATRWRFDRLDQTLGAR